MCEDIDLLSDGRTLALWSCMPTGEQPKHLRIVAPCSSRPTVTVQTGQDELARLADLAARGDARAIRTFVVLIGPHLLRVVRRVLGTHHPDVDDVVQEAVFSVIRALPKFRGECTVLHFVCRLAVLTATGAQRRDAALKRPQARDEQDVELLTHSLPTVDDAVIARISAEAVRGLLATLPPAQAETLALQAILGYTLEEIATATGAPIETVHSRLRLAKQLLRRQVLGDPRWREFAEEEP
jgi:RNA polymerase sigma factor (sigma-70 family)